MTRLVMAFPQRAGSLLHLMRDTKEEGASAMARIAKRTATEP
jgi:hypothetical protein